MRYSRRAFFDWKEACFSLRMLEAAPERPHEIDGVGQLGALGRRISPIHGPPRIPQGVEDRLVEQLRDAMGRGVLKGRVRRHGVVGA